MLDLSSIGRIEFGTLGPGWQNITGVEILSTVIPLPTLAKDEIDFDNITVELVRSSSIRVMDFGVGAVLSPNNYVEDGLRLTAIDSGPGGSSHFDIGNFDEDDITVAQPTTLLLFGLGLGRWRVRDHACVSSAPTTNTLLAYRRYYRPLVALFSSA
jgi:hypothetical protein